MDTVLDWDILIQPVLFAYHTKKLRIINTKRAIKKAQQKIEKKFQNEGTKFRKGEFVLYFKKVEVLCHNTRIEPK